MSKLKKVLLTVTAYALVAALAIGGTVAYLQDEDSAVNVMTLGNVYIEQIEQERDSNGNLVDFTQAKPLYPAVGEIAWNDNKININGHDYNMFGEKLKNAQDKIVTVKNTGKSDAYIRTIVALEDPYDTVMLGINHGDVGYTPEDLVVTINDVQYSVFVYTYDKALAPGESSLPSLLQVYMKSHATNEDVAKLGDTYDILVLSQAVQTAGFDSAAAALDTAFGEANATNVAAWLGGEKMPTLVSSAAELQAALDAAVDGDTIILGADIEGDVTVTQKAGVKFTLDGNGKTFDGSIIVDGKSARYETAGITIKNVKFASDNAAPDAYINLGVSGNNNTRYTNNVTVSNCTFDYSGAGDKVAIKSYTGGDYNLTVEGCTVNAGMHSFLQVTNIEKGLTVTGCKVNSKNGINLNNTPYLNMSGCEFDTKGYCVRFGVNGSTNSGNFTIANSTLKSANDDGDAVIILRGTMTNATLNLEGTTLTGTPDITGTANIAK